MSCNNGKAFQKNLVWHNGQITRQERCRLNHHRSGLIWFTGLPASGKSTIAHTLEKALFDRGIRTYVLDGDNVRHGLNAGLGFSREDRKENLRRIAELSKLFVDAGVIVLAAFVSPYQEDREYIKGVVGDDSFFEVFVQCPPEICEHRDPKGHYKEARAGIIKGYTGVSAPYEEPENPDITLDTNELTVDESADQVLEFLDHHKFILVL